MAADINIFHYSGHGYFLNAAIQTVGSGKDPINLANENIEKFECVNEINRLYLTANLVYKDTTGAIDRFVQSKYVLCNVFVGQVDEKSDGQFKVEDVKSDYYHSFFVQGFEITKREGDNITYNIHLVSTFYYNIIGVWDYSNYDKYANGKSETCLDVMKQCLKDYQMTIGSSFDDINSSVPVKYITNGNDDLHTVINFLQNKELYYDKRVESMKFLYYDNLTNKVEIFDTANQVSLKKMAEIRLSFFRQDVEDMTYQDPANFGSIVDSSNSDFFASNFSRTIYDYSFDTNEIKPVKIESDNIKSLFNKSMANGMEGVKDINTGIYQPGSNVIRFNRSYSYWNNGMNLYDEQLNNLLKNNSYVINCAGSVFRKPGDYINLKISKDTSSNMQDEDKKLLEELSERYSGFGGPWFCSKVKSMISPQLGVFRQNLYLFRNFRTEVQKHG